MTDTPMAISKAEKTILYLGFHTAYWNKAEEALDKLLVCAIGDAAKAHILTAGANAAKRIKFVKLIYEECCADKPWQETALAALAALDVLRQNRNALAHSVALGLSDEDGILDVKIKTQHPAKRLHKRLQIDAERIALEVDQVVALTRHLNLLRGHIYHLEGAHLDFADMLRGERPALPDRFPLPAALQTPESQNYTEPVVRLRRLPKE